MPRRAATAAHLVVAKTARQVPRHVAPAARRAVAKTGRQVPRRALIAAHLVVAKTARQRPRRALIAALLVVTGIAAAALAWPSADGDGQGRVLTRTSSTRITAGVGWTHRWTAAPGGATDAAGNQWESDAAVAQGGGAPKELAAGSSAPYRYSRSGTPTFSLPVPQPGTYAVTLSLAAPERGAAPEAAVTVNGQRVRLAGTAAGRVRHATVLVPVTGDTATVAVTALEHLAGVTAVTATMARTGTDPLRAELAEEFDGTGPLTGWTPELGGGGWGNGELQEYTANPANAARTGDGRLAITARHDGGKYTSARLRSDFTAQYGRIESVLAVPTGKGLLPAFWMLGADVATTGWPAAGEIDIMESLGADRVYGTFHGPDGSERGWERQFTAVSKHGPHRYSLEWWPGLLQWSVDGVVQATLREEDLGAKQAWVFERPMFLLLNVAVGGRWPGTPPSSTGFPQTMYVESVQWWR
ncbi:glycoside hydrolase family 16 protein [Dactylosporangium sp. CS-033363]|uniref:glycoside hydrolase family 16 protein n=1 Tax=Dactylosporangium sp. CS-033363 TaxID=3239935 RepID=UPI003D94F001